MIHLRRLDPTTAARWARVSRCSKSDTRQISHSRPLLATRDTRIQALLSSVERRDENVDPTRPRLRQSPITSSLDGKLDHGMDPFNQDIGAGSHRLHVYATKHNVHLTLVQPSKLASKTTSSSVSETSASPTERNKVVDTLLSFSAGNIGFRKAARGTYDAAYQLAGYTLRQMQEKGILRDINSLEVILRGFGEGRVAVVKAILGVEGKPIRSRIRSVVDATRLKHGGTRSPRPRRLG